MRYCCDCKKRATFNIIGLKSRYCGTHRLDGMINVNSPRCIHNGCNSICPVFNKVGETQGKYCGPHKLDGMVDVINKRCIHDGCNSISPKFNKEGEKQGKYCGTHRLDGMVDVIHKRCIHDGCISLNPSFNKEGEKKGLYCGTHRLDGMIDVIGPRCKTHLCDIHIRNKQYQGYCLRCFIYTFPDAKVARNYKTKEKDVIDRIKSKFSSLTLIEDKKIQGGCSKRRPDGLLDLGTHLIDLEIDENKHETYDSSCENFRTMQISQDVGHRPIVFIRFNPDAYINKDCKKITSCWKANGNGILTVPKNKVKEWESRIADLINHIQYWVDNTAEKTVEIFPLYYDNY